MAAATAEPPMITGVDLPLSAERPRSRMMASGQARRRTAAHFYISSSGIRLMPCRRPQCRERQPTSLMSMPRWAGTEVMFVMRADIALMLMLRLHERPDGDIYRAAGRDIDSMIGVIFSISRAGPREKFNRAGADMSWPTFAEFPCRTLKFRVRDQV